jgi:DNA primase
MKISQTTIDQIDALDITDIISGYLDLKKSGVNYSAPCPFHDEKTGSFVVSPQKQIYHCFGCGAGGRGIKFVEEYEKKSFPEAVETIADKFGIEVQYDGKVEDRKNLPLLEEVNLFFQRELQKNSEALSYLESRGVTSNSIEKFQLGYSPSSYDFLSYFQKKGISFKDLEEIGVVSFDEKGNPYSRFIERVTFPIFSGSGKVIAFGGRILGKESKYAKYINSPTTKYFNKSATLYGYNFARVEASRKGEFLVVEGYLDVVLLHQAGFSNAVAPLGTSLTNEHTPLLKRGEMKVHLAMDGDSAGKEAMSRALDLIIPTGLESSVTSFPSGTDPADLVKDGDIEKLEKILGKRSDGVKFRLWREIQKFNWKENPYEKEKAVKGCKAIFSKLPSEILRDEYRKVVEEFLEANIEASAPERRVLEAYEIKGVAELQVLRAVIEDRELHKEFSEILSPDDFLHWRDIAEIVTHGHWHREELNPIKLFEIPSLGKDDFFSALLTLREFALLRELQRVSKSISEDKFLQIRQLRGLITAIRKERRKI